MPGQINFMMAADMRNNHQAPNDTTRPVPPEIPKSARATTDKIDRNMMSIESTIRWRERAHPTPLPGEHLRGISSKRCACSILPLPKGQGFPAFLEEAPSKRGGVAS
jgi:hypothetical protein